jgi:hypothetical protein
MLTAEVTPYTGNGERPATRKEMEKGFLFNGIHVSGNQHFVDQTVKDPSSILPYLADTPFPIGYEAVMVTQVAFYFFAVQFFIKKGLFHYKTKLSH